jgi:hypothetical protein
MKNAALIFTTIAGLALVATAPAKAQGYLVVDSLAAAAVAATVADAYGYGVGYGYGPQLYYPGYYGVPVYRGGRHVGRRNH